MSQLTRACTALGLTLLAVTALGTAGSALAGPAHTRTPGGEHSVVRAEDRTEVNNTGSNYDPPPAKM
ncbi:hypothetical protein ACPCBC_16535 [Streptomyces incarnatus]|uniref:hypothetical protein n=1 Tax=Streptomyces sp. HF10 TaxID=2692233 RepID=UPI00119EB7CC|nr:MULTISPECIES: hypothetical protein [Streptomyces]QHC29526.1 hypothetical protein GR129_12545 [Streptomyces sp. HF10]